TQSIARICGCYGVRSADTRHPRSRKYNTQSKPVGLLTAAAIWFARRRRCRRPNSPARLAPEQPQCRLPDDLVHQPRVRWVEAATAHVAVQPLELVRLEHPCSAGDIHRDV